MAHKPLNGSRDIIALLLDSIMHAEYLKALTDIGKSKLTSISQTIMEKCKAAASNVNLINNPNNTRQYLEIIRESVKNKTGTNITPLIENYDCFVSIYKELL